MPEAESPVVIRPYERSDRPRFAQLVADVLAEYGFTVDPLLEADLEAPELRYQAIWVAVEQEEVVGSAAMRVLDDGITAELKRMYLRPECRGRGLGRALLDEAISWARGRPCQSIILDTSESMAAAQRLYQSAGFRRTGTRIEAGAQDSRCEVLYKLVLTDPD